MRAPFLIGMTNPDYWRAYVSLMRWRSNSRRFKPVGKVTPDYVQKLLTHKTKLEECTELEELRVQALIRLGEAACDSLGKVLVTLSTEESGIRLVLRTGYLWVVLRPARVRTPVSFGCALWLELSTSPSF